MTTRGAASPRVRRFYSEALNEAERADFPLALDVEGVDQEIAVLRLRLRTALKQHPEDLQLMVRGIAMLVRALAAKYRLPGDEAEALAGAFVGEIEGDLWPAPGAAEEPAKAVEGAAGD